MSKHRSKSASHSRYQKPRTKIIIASGEKIRSFTFRPWLAAAGMAGGLLLTTAYISATGYLVFRDGILNRSVFEQSQIKLNYEDRVAELRDEIDRLNSRPAPDTRQTDAAVQKLLGRQAALDARQDMITSVRAMARKAGIDIAGAVLPPSPATVVPTPIAAPDTSIITGSIAPTPVPLADDPPLASLALRTSAEIDDASPPAPSQDAQLSVVAKSLDDIERQQIAFVTAVSGSVAQQTRQITSVLDGIGQKVQRRPMRRPIGEGGPYVPAGNDTTALAFRDGITAISDGIAIFQAARDMARQLPLWRPVSTDQISSGFGERSDPFLGTSAVHEGVDFLAEYGSAVSATAPGTVTAAGPNGGYGNMVEIDHGNGLVTRYGHLSVISVKVGAKVSPGTIIGKVGSTGRSTGPHLHYEVRVNDRPLDPLAYIRAGGALRGVL